MSSSAFCTVVPKIASMSSTTGWNGGTKSGSENLKFYKPTTLYIVHVQKQKLAPPADVILQRNKTDFSDKDHGYFFNRAKVSEKKMLPELSAICNSMKDELTHCGLVMPWHHRSWSTLVVKITSTSITSVTAFRWMVQDPTDDKSVNGLVLSDNKPLSEPRPQWVKHC